MRNKRIVRITSIVLLALTAALFLFACGGDNDDSGASGDGDGGKPVLSTRVVGYLPDWAYSFYNKLDFADLTHVNIAFCNPTDSGALSCDISDSDLKAIVTKAHAAGTKVIAALGGGGYCDPYRDLISTPEGIRNLNDSIEVFCDKYDLDGVDLDIELDSSDSVWDHYAAWVTELRALCDEKDWLLSTATAQWVAARVSEQTFAMFDYLNVMAYDNDNRIEKSHASYNFAVDCLDYFHDEKKVPKDKLVLGVPFYGRGYDNSGNLDWNSYLSFAEIVRADVSLYDADVTSGGVAYNGAATMRKKCALAREYGGIMIWEITLDASGEYSLLRLINEELTFPSTPV